MPFPENLDEIGSFVPTTNIWDVQDIQDINVNSPEFKELIVRLYQNVNLISNVLNTKESAFYLTESFNNSQVWFKPNSTTADDLRPCYSLVVDTGALGAGLKQVLHNITPAATWTFTKILGGAVNVAGLLFYPLPKRTVNLYPAK